MCIDAPFESAKNGRGKLCALRSLFGFAAVIQPTSPYREIGIQQSSLKNPKVCRLRGENPPQGRRGRDSIILHYSGEMAILKLTRYLLRWAIETTVSGSPRFKKMFFQTRVLRRPLLHVWVNHSQQSREGGPVVWK